MNGLSLDVANEYQKKPKERTILKGRFFRGVLIGFLSFLFVLLLHEFQVFRPLERKSWDLRFRLFSSPPKADERIAVFLIDQYSLDVYEKQQGLSWPWPREIYSYLVDYLCHGKARAICFDLVFSESSIYG
ncbi:MAG: CHASE2 domain-containing protein, partial [Candidatus Aminicenantes bacterium]|nr:CHASE2 domain-containing protein [Candidatus Aminicenantes bacterium]